MYVAVVALTMFVLPLGAIVIQHIVSPADPIMLLTGRWFVFWAVGVRLGLAGARQMIQPSFTARQIFHLSSDEALPLVRELGVANAGTALVGLLSIAVPDFALPTAISAAVFYGVAGLTHSRQRSRGVNENIAMISDLWATLVLLAFIANHMLMQ